MRHPVQVGRDVAGDLVSVAAAGDLRVTRDVLALVLLGIKEVFVSGVGPRQ